MPPRALPSVELVELAPAHRPFLDTLVDAEPVTDPTAERLKSSTYGGSARLVVHDGTPVGIVTWIALPYGPTTADLAYNLGIEIARGARGRGLGAAAQRAAAELLFTTTTTNRVEACTRIDHTAERRSLELAGFGLDGIVRGAHYDEGAYHDLALYGLLRDELAILSAAGPDRPDGTAR